MNEEMKNMLNEDELRQVNGGTIARAGMRGTGSQEMRVSYEEHTCSKCGRKTTFMMYSGGRGVCTACNTEAYNLIE